MRRPDVRAWLGIKPFASWGESPTDYFGFVPSCHTEVEFRAASCDYGRAIAVMAVCSGGPILERRRAWTYPASWREQVLERPLGRLTVDGLARRAQQFGFRLRQAA